MSIQTGIEPVSNPPHVSRYRWYILALAALTHTLVIAMPTMSLPVLFDEIGRDLGLSLLQIGTIWGLGSLTGIGMALMGGVFSDRLGAKRTLVIGCLVAGLTGALRGFAVDFATLGITVFFAGLMMPVIPISVHKTCGVWFSGRRLGLANGVVAVGMALGFMLGSLLGATLLSPLLGGWRNVIFFYGAVAITISVIWSFTRPTPAVNGQPGAVTRVSLRAGWKHVGRLPDVWLLGLAMIGIGGAIQGALGYLPLYLRTIGWPAAAADATLASFHAISLLFTIPIALLSDRLGTRRKVLLVATVMIATGFSLLSIVDGFLIIVAVMLAGVTRDGFMAVLMSMIVELRGIGAIYAGTATGLVIALSMVGRFVAPPLGNSLASVNASLPFLFWGAMAAAGLIGLYLVKERRA